MIEPLRRAAGVIVPTLALVVTGLSYAAIPAIWITSIWMQADLFSALDTARPGAEQLSALIGPVMVGVTVQGLTLVVILVTYLFIPGFIASIFALPVALAWRCPKRFLVLRRFDDRAASKELNRVLNRYLAPAGHVYTLADQDIRIPWYIRFPLIFTQLIFLHFRQRQVRSRDGLKSFLTSMEVSWARNVNWIVARSKTFAIRSSDAVWREVVEALTDRVDAVLVDISRRSDHLAWEIDRLRSGGRLPRTIFIARQAHESEAKAFLEDLGIGEEIPKLLTYDTHHIRQLPVRMAAERVTQRAAPFWKHLTASLSFVGPLAWGALAMGVLWTQEPLQEPPSTNRFTVLVEKVRQAPDDDQAFDTLMHRTAAGPQREPAGKTALHAFLAETGPLSWRRDFAETVAPLLVELWDRAPERRSAMLAAVQDVGTPALAPFWRKAILEASHKPDALGWALVGITSARSLDNVSDILKALRNAPTPSAKRMLATLGDLADPRAVTQLLEQYTLQLDGAQPAVLRSAADSALKKILLRPILPHGPPVAGDGGKPWYTLAVSATDPQTQSDAFAAVAQYAQRSGTLQTFGISLPKLTPPGTPDNLQIPLLEVLINLQERQVSIVQSPSFENLAVAIIAAKPIPDALLMIVDPASPWEAAFLQQVQLVQYAQIRRLIVSRRFTGDRDVDQAFDKRLAQIGIAPDAFQRLDGPLDTALPSLVQRIVRTSKPMEARSAVFPVVAVARIRDRGTLAIGYYEQGKFGIGQRLGVVGFGSTGRVGLQGTEELIKGRRIGLWLTESEGLQLRPGHVLTAGGYAEKTAFEAWVYFANPEEGGRRSPIIPGHSISVRMRGTQVNASFEMPVGNLPSGGDHMRLIVRLSQPLYVSPGSRFSLWSRAAQIGVGVVRNTLKPGEEGRAPIHFLPQAPQAEASADDYLARAKVAQDANRLDVAKQHMATALAVAKQTSDLHNELKALIALGVLVDQQARVETNLFDRLMKSIEAANWFGRAWRLIQWQNHLRGTPDAQTEVQQLLLESLERLAARIGSKDDVRRYREALQTLKDRAQ